MLHSVFTVRRLIVSNYKQNIIDDNAAAENVSFWGKFLFQHVVQT